MTEYTCDSFRFFNLFPVYFGGKGTVRQCPPPVFKPGCNFLLCFRLGFAGEYFAAFDSLLVKVPDDALPAAIGSPKYIAVGG